MTPGNVPPLMNSFQAPVIKEKVAVDDTAQQIVYSVSQGGGLMNRQEDINKSEPNTPNGMLFSNGLMHEKTLQAIANLHA